MPYSRQAPSPRYQQLLAMYQQLHVQGESAAKPAAATFPGHSLFAHAERVKGLLSYYGSKSVLDYGAGKGIQYQPMTVNVEDGTRFNSIPEYWGVTVRCYDPAYAPFSTLPTHPYDAVISTDVLEHCPVEDLPWIIDEMFGFARHFVFTNVACYAANKHLPNGENARATIQPPQWWQPYFIEASQRHGNLPFLVLVTTRDAEGNKHYSAFASDRPLAA